MASEFVKHGRRLLDQAWQEALQAEGAFLYNSDLAIAADRVFGGEEQGYRKAIVIQAAGKAANSDLDAQSMQKGNDSPGSWDAREFAKSVFVPWNMAANTPFAHASDPYVSNPYRIPRFDDSVRGKRKRKVEFDSTLIVLEILNSTLDPVNAYRNLCEVVYALRRFVANREVAYPLPNRASLLSTHRCMENFLSQRSGGARLQAVVLALFEVLSAAGMRYEDILSRHVNATDRSGREAGDIDFSAEGTRWAVEVKDRALTLSEFDATIEKCRTANIVEAVVVVRAARILDDSFSQVRLQREVERQFSSGLNVYVVAFGPFSGVVLTLIGEDGRRRFLEGVGHALTRQNADVTHKWAWAGLVKAI